MDGRMARTRSTRPQLLLAANDSEMHARVTMDTIESIESGSQPNHSLTTTTTTNSPLHPRQAKQLSIEELPQRPAGADRIHQNSRPAESKPEVVRTRFLSCC